MEWIERPLLMLEVRGSNPGHSASKNTTSLPQTLEVSIRGWVQLQILELGDEAGRGKAKKEILQNQILKRCDRTLSMGAVNDFFPARIY